MASPAFEKQVTQDWEHREHYLQLDIVGGPRVSFAFFTEEEQS